MENDDCPNAAADGIHCSRCAGLPVARTREIEKLHSEVAKFAPRLHVAGVRRAIASWSPWPTAATATRNYAQRATRHEWMSWRSCGASPRDPHSFKRVRARSNVG